MPPRKVAVFGGDVEEVERILDLIPSGYEIEKPSARRRLGLFAKKEQPALAIVLNGQSDGEGLNTLRKVIKKYRKTPVLAISPHPSPKTVIEAFRLGASDFLIYPPGKDEFQAVFAQLAHNGVSSGRKAIFHPKAWYRRIKKWLGYSPPEEQWKAGPHYPLPPTPIVEPVLPGRLMLPAPEAEGHQSGLEILLFGTFSIHLNGKPLKKPPGKKVNALLAYFLYHHHKPIHREILMDKFWGAYAPSSARNSLNVAVYTIRKHLHKVLPHSDILIYKNDYYQFDPELSIMTDVERFVSHWNQGHTLEASRGLSYAAAPYLSAARLYTGDFLSGYPYEDWCESERDNLKETYLFILERLSTYYFQEGDYPSTARICAQMLEKDPCLEEVHRKLIIAYCQLGYRDKAVRQYYKCAKALRNELDVAPSPQTQALFERLSKGKIEVF